MEDATIANAPVTIRDLLDAGLHFGHQTKRWNPKMKPFIFDKRNGIHIIDLNKSMFMLQESAKFARGIGEAGGTMLIVGTKKQAQKIVNDVATANGQPYVSHRWMGGMLTNAETIRARVARLKELELAEKNGGIDAMHKKEAARARAELAKLRRNLSGIADMRKRPSVMFVIDINRSHRHQGSQPPRDSNYRHGRHQLRPGYDRLPDPRQRRRHPRHPAGDAGSCGCLRQWLFQIPAEGRRRSPLEG